MGQKSISTASKERAIYQFYGYIPVLSEFFSLGAVLDIEVVEL